MTTPRVTVNGITGYIQNESVYLSLHDLSIGLGFSKYSAEGTLQPDWDALAPALEKLGLSAKDCCASDSFVPVYVFHRLAGEIGTPAAQGFREYVDNTVLPALEKQAKIALSSDTIEPSITTSSQDSAETVAPKGQSSDTETKENAEITSSENANETEKVKKSGNAGCLLFIALFIAAIIGFNVYLHRETAPYENIQREKQKNSESTPQVTVAASDAKETASTTQTKKPSSNIISDFDKLSLVIAAEDAIKKELVSPNSAKFPVYSLWDVEKIGDTYYSVTSYVDAKNRLGVELRQDVNVIIDYNGLSYSILFVTIDDEVYMGSSLPVKAA